MHATLIKKTANLYGEWHPVRVGRAVNRRNVERLQQKGITAVVVETQHGEVFLTIQQLSERI